MASSEPASAGSAVALSVVVGAGGGCWWWVVAVSVVRGPSLFLDFLPICVDFLPSTESMCTRATRVLRARRSQLALGGDKQRTSANAIKQLDRARSTLRRQRQKYSAFDVN